MRPSKLFIVDLLGSTLYNNLSAAYQTLINDDTPLSADKAALLPYVQRCLSYYVQLLAIPHLAVTFGDQGIRQNASSDHSSPASRAERDLLRFNALKNGDIHADKLLEFLEQKATDMNEYQPWLISSSSTINSGFIVLQHNGRIASRRYQFFTPRIS
ncbi:MAG: DUF6712 family protein [Bacteroidota bacterium]